ncbi:MAG: hypothetical protein R2831_01175 [Chitinophagaceae bacterium]
MVCKILINNVTHEGKNGFIAEVASAKSLYEKMLQLYELSNEERSKMGQYGRDLVLKKYDEKIIVQEYLQIVESLA